MSVLDSTSVVALIVLAVIRLGVPVMGLWLLSSALKRALPAQV
jgi:hypothetical protein